MKKGFKHSKLARERMSNAHEGLKYSEEHKRKISEGKIGKKRPPFSKETKKKMSEYHKKLIGEKNNRWGTHHSEETKRKMSLASKGKPKSEEHKRKVREWVVNNPNRKFKDTSIELKVEAELKRRSINYQKQVPLCNIAIVDFYLPEYRITIQCDGDYWHNLLERKIKDEEQNKVLLFNGFNIFRFWEHEIDRDVKGCVDKLRI